MEIVHDNDDIGGEFYLDDPDSDEQPAELSYRREGKRITVTHVEVDARYEGKGYGKQLVAEVVKYAREEKLEVAATCPFAKHVFESAPDYSDVYVT
jgi:predicted GNAT family acetyltransferase